MRVDPPRLAAYDVLTAVRTQDAYANLLLPRLLAERGIGARDAAFATELVGGTLRWRGAYDAVLDHLATRPLDDDVRDALRLGVHQVLHMRVPDYAAVTSTVELVRRRVGHRPAGFVNALMRRLTTRGLEDWLDEIDAPLHVRWSHPRWVVDELRRALDRDEELEALLAADNEPPRVTLVARPGLADREELGEPTRYSPFGAVLPSGDPGALPAVAEGRAGVQDEGSQLVALALAEAPLTGRDERWLDLCAGPGGKAALLGAIAAQRGARLLAVEKQPHRADLVRQAMAALPKGVVDVRTADATATPWDSGSFDRVLLDAPCTGLGALRRRPEARWRRAPGDVQGLARLQHALLESALDAVRPGGLLAYATCSPVLAETAEVVDGRGDASLVDATTVLGQVPDCAGPVPGTVQLWPHRHGTDAMFLALMRRDG